MDSFIDLEKSNTENEFVLRRAKVYKLCGDGNKIKDDRIQVKVLPNLLGIPKEELQEHLDLIILFMMTVKINVIWFG